MRDVKPIIFGLIGTVGLLAIYFGVLTFAESSSYALSQFLEMWYWISLLAVGFGIQLGLHTHIKAALRQRRAGAAAGVAASGGVSTVAMVACCAHHVTDVLPILGLSAAAVFLVEYQTAFLVLGVFSNLIGVTMMLRVMQKHGLAPKDGLFKPLFSLDMKRVLGVVIVSSVIAVAASFLISATAAAGQDSEAANGGGTFDLAAKTSKENKLTVKVKPVDLAFGKPVSFSVTMNTHTGSLDFDMTAISVLEDDRGNAFQATAWEGAASGGHHRSGTLFFPALGAGTKSIKLTLKDMYGVPERVFEWTLQ